MGTLLSILIIIVLATACYYLYKAGRYREFNSPDEKIYDDKLHKKDKK